jgi:hypothetical protein
MPGSPSPRISVIIPAVDEEEAIGLVIAEIPRVVHEVIVVDNGSRDRTADVARAAGARVVSEPRRGYGRACLAGIAAADRPDVFVFLDGDRSDFPAQLPEVVAPILEGRADMVIGSRTLGRREGGAQPWHAIVGTRLCVGFMNLTSGSEASDLGPFRAITAEALHRLDMRDPDYGWTVEMQIKAARIGLRVVEIPVDYRPRIGRSKVSGTFAGTVGAGTKILALIARDALMRREGKQPTSGLTKAGSRPAVLVVCGAIISLCVAGWASGGPPTAHIAPHLGLFGAAFAAYLGALAASRGLSRRGLLGALGLALAWRMVLVVAPPLLSDDIYRYVWEGRIQNHGGNPFRWGDRPDAERWTPLRDGVWEGMNHRHMTAVYPPLFQIAARGVTGVHDSVTAMKIFLVLCEIVTVGLLALLLRRRGLGGERLLVLAWSPLALVEIAGSGHNEAFGMLWLVAALLALERDRPLLSALAAAAGFMAKLLPGLLAAAWARRYRPLHVLAALGLVALLVWPYRDAGRTLFFSLSRFARFWRFNETLFAPLAALLERLLAVRGRLGLETEVGGHDAAVRAGVLITLSLALLLAWRRTEPVAAALVLVAASLVLSPNVLPWYALWFLPLLVVRDEPAALLFTGTVGLAYLVYPAYQSGEPWKLGWGVRALEYLPCLVVLVLTHRRRRGSPAPS